MQEKTALYFRISDWFLLPPITTTERGENPLSYWSDVKTVTGYAKLMPDAYKGQINNWWEHGPEV
ncbi:hypothetical protein HK25_12485 [Acetobacter sp. DsW_059]|nr:hypothetical protein HK25_12485 [Acetobacter sp. DsW_059]